MLSIVYPFSRRPYLDQKHQIRTKPENTKSDSQMTPYPTSCHACQYWFTPDIIMIRVNKNQEKTRQKVTRKKRKGKPRRKKKNKGNNAKLG